MKKKNDTHTNGAVTAGGMRFKTGFKDRGEPYGGLKRLVDAACDAALARRGISPKLRWRHPSRDADPIGP